jgi:hypothetical protein
VETVKGFTKEESTVFGDIANARAGMLNAQGPAAKIAANGQLDGAIGRLLLLTENYPQLRSSDQFMRLQDELAGTENRISVARRRYNDALRDYNTFVLQFPNSIWAGMAGFHARTSRQCPTSSSDRWLDFAVPANRGNGNGQFRMNEVKLRKIARHRFSRSSRNAWVTPPSISKSMLTITSLSESRWAFRNRFLAFHSFTLAGEGLSAKPAENCRLSLRLFSQP